MFGLEKFCRKAKSAGATGFIIPDVPYDEEPNTRYIETCRKHQLDPALVISPITSEERLKYIGKLSGFMIYCVAGSGVTGQNRVIEDRTKLFISTIRKHTELPIALGVGIATREQMDKAGKIADIVVVGTQIIRLRDEAPEGQKLKAIRDFLS